jgi:hypothetical protein
MWSSLKLATAEPLEDGRECVDPISQSCPVGDEHVPAVCGSRGVSLFQERVADTASLVPLKLRRHAKPLEPLDGGLTLVLESVLYLIEIGSAGGPRGLILALSPGFRPRVLWLAAAGLAGPVGFTLLLRVDLLCHGSSALFIR